MDERSMGVDRREFLKVATAGAGLTLAGVSKASAEVVPSKAPAIRSGQVPDVVVVGAGSFGMWTSLYLNRLGAKVTVVDPYGPANSRSTSGGETRGVRTSYGDRIHGPLWTRLAHDCIRRWTEWDAQWADAMLPRVFFNTGDLIMREELTPYMEDTRAQWDDLGIEYEVLTADEIKRRWPVINTETVGAALYEPGAGVVRARRAIESVAQVFQHEGGEIRMGRAGLGSSSGGRLNNLTIEPGGSLSGQIYVLALGPWFPKFLPELMGKRIRIPMGYTFYFGTPPGDNRYSFPNLPSYGVPGCTGWPALGRDHRGFRVRSGGRSAEDPDLSDRWVDSDSFERPRQILADWFPGLADAPLLETRACHYESSVDRNFIVDKHPDYDNVWLAGGGSAEGFKFGPFLGEHIARRVLDIEHDPELVENFALKEKEFSDEEREGRRRRDPGESGKG